MQKEGSLNKMKRRRRETERKSSEKILIFELNELFTIFLAVLNSLSGVFSIKLLIPPIAVNFILSQYPSIFLDFGFACLSAIVFFIFNLIILHLI